MRCGFFARYLRSSKSQSLIIATTKNMDSNVDFYQILGVLPDAEQIVVTAAYRALASRYHPDRWSGDKTEATRRMSEINAAYDVLGNPEKRANYDKTRSSRTSDFGDNSEQVDAAFDSAMQELEARWQTAVSLMPDLQNLRDRLKKTADRLAFAFVILMLESKKFHQRLEIAQAMEDNFLEQFFGTNLEIINFAKLLISAGNKQGVKALNNYVDVVGSDIPAQVIIQKVTDQFKIKIYTAKQVNGEPLRAIKDNVRRWGHANEVQSLIVASGLECIEKRSGVFSTTEYEIFTSKGTWGQRLLVTQLKNSTEMILWVRANLC